MSRPDSALAVSLLNSSPWQAKPPATQPSSNRAVNGGSTRASENTDELKRSALDKIRRVKRPFVPDTYRVSGLQKWTGRVLEMDADLFTAELVPASDGPTVIADFDRSQIAAEDELVAGDIIYVTVRTVKGQSGQPNRTSSIRLRRLGNWSREDIARHDREAEEVKASMEDLVG